VLALPVTALARIRHNRPREHAVSYQILYWMSSLNANIRIGTQSVCLKPYSNNALCIAHLNFKVKSARDDTQEGRCCYGTPGLAAKQLTGSAYHRLRHFEFTEQELVGRLARHPFNNPGMFSIGTSVGRYKNKEAASYLRNLIFGSSSSISTCDHSSYVCKS
jgi:hypothetical protein